MAAREGEVIKRRTFAYNPKTAHNNGQKDTQSQKACKSVDSCDDNRVPGLSDLQYSQKKLDTVDNGEENLIYKEKNAVNSEINPPRTRTYYSLLLLVTLLSAVTRLYEIHNPPHIW